MHNHVGKPFAGPIAYLTGEYPRATDTFIQREVAALRSRGIDVLTCSIRKTGTEHHVGAEQRSEAQNTFHVLAHAKSPVNFLRSHAKVFLGAPKRYLSGLRLALRTRPPGARGLLYQLFYFTEAVVLADYLSRQGAIHLHNHIATASCTVAMLASAVSGIPYSYTIHGPGIFFEPMYWRIDAKTAQASFVACISDFCRSQVMMFSDQAHWSKLHVVHCGVEPSAYGAAERNGRRVLFVGRLAGVKGIPVLFAALEKVLPEFRDLRVTLIGDGPERRQLEAEAKARGLAGVVEFAGYKSQADVATALQTTDLFVLPSFAEGVPVVLMEAMAARVPVVSSRVAGIPELVEDGVSGVLVAPGDIDALARGMADLLRDPARRARMGDAGRLKVIADFNLQQEAGWLAELLDAYIHDEPRPAKRRVTDMVVSEKGAA